MRLQLALSFFVLGASRLAAQELIDNFNGYSTQQRLGTSCCSMSDIDGDGVGEFLIGAEKGKGVRGEVYLFSGSSRAVIGYFVGEDSGDRFSRVATIGDIDLDGIDDFMVGCYQHDNVWTDQGKVYVYSGSTLTLIRAHGGEGPGSDYFGRSVSPVRDIDLDGVPDYGIGATLHDSLPMVQVGRVYLYSGASGALLYSVDGFHSDQDFGTEVAPAGDLDGDSTPDFIVGSLESGGSGLGRVDVFSGRTGSSLFSIVGTGTDAAFGWEVDGEADVNGDQVPDLLVTAYTSSPTGFVSGAAYVYSGLDASVIYSWSGPKAGDQFGMAGAFVGDVNGDQVSEVLVSSCATTADGAAFLYSGRSGRLLYRLVSNRAADYFGLALSAAGDIDSDGLADLLITAPYDDQPYRDDGRAYLFSGNDLFLHASSALLSAGDVVTITTSSRDSGAFVLTFIVDLNGIPTMILLDAGLSDSFGVRSLTGTVPPGLSGVTVSLTSFATDKQAGAIDSAVESLVIQ